MRALILISLVTFIAGVAAVLVAANSPTWIDADGFLHEPFAYMVLGPLLLALSMIFGLVAAVLGLVRRRRNENNDTDHD